MRLLLLAAARPDYVNVEPTPDGLSSGDNWTEKPPRAGRHTLSTTVSTRLVTYNDLFENWEQSLRFQVKAVMQDQP